MNILVILQLGLVSLIFNATNFEDIVFIFHYTSRQVFMHECPLPDFPREKPITKEWSGNILTSSQVKIFIFFPFLCESRVLDSKENLSQPFFIAVGTWRITWSIIRIFEKPLPPLSLYLSAACCCSVFLWLVADEEEKCLREDNFLSNLIRLLECRVRGGGGGKK